MANKYKSYAQRATNILNNTALVLVTLCLICFAVLWSLGILRRRQSFAHSCTPHSLRVGKSLDNVPQDRSYFESRKVVICGILSDVEHQVEYLKTGSLKTIADQFAEYKIVIVVDRDNTDELLREWLSEDPHVAVLRSTSHDPVVLRNLYLEYINASEELKEYDFVVVADMNLRSKIYLDGLWNTAQRFADDTKIDAIGSYGISQTPVLNGTLCLTTFYDSASHADKSGFNSMLHPYLFHLNKAYAYGEELVPLLSCFNGLIFYRKASLRGLYYKNDKRSATEHITLNRQLQHVYMNPSLLHVIHLSNRQGL